MLNLSYRPLAVPVGESGLVVVVVVNDGGAGELGVAMLGLGISSRSRAKGDGWWLVIFPDKKDDCVVAGSGGGVW